jgi:hypothetical protein
MSTENNKQNKEATKSFKEKYGVWLFTMSFILLIFILKFILEMIMN